MTIQPTTTGKRIVFLDSLRAIAVLLVAWGHIYLVGINDITTVGIWVPDVKGFAFGPTTAQDNIHAVVALWAAIKLGLGVGGIGVSLFFLISGFVILRTIDRINPVPFIIQRFFRIIPTCFFCVMLVAGITYAYCSAKGLNQPNTIAGVFASTFAANYFNSSFTTIPVLWTLEIEMLFYIIIAVAASIFKRLGYKELIFISVLCLSFVLAYSIPFGVAKAKPDILRHFSVIFVHISYMMIGAIIYRAYESSHGFKGITLALTSISIYLIAYGCYWNATQMDIGSNLPSSATALIIFVIGMLSGMQSKLFTPLRWVATISYPLYLLHIPLAWGFLYFFASLGMGMNLSAFLATAAVILMAWLTHHAIELPFQRIGKKASNLWGNRPLPSAEKA